MCFNIFEIEVKGNIRDKISAWTGKMGLEIKGEIFEP